MRLRIIKNRPIFAPGGSVQDKRQDINVSSTQPILDYGTPVNKWGESDIQNIYMPSDVTLETEEGEINPFSSMPTSDPFFENHDKINEEEYLKISFCLLSKNMDDYFFKNADSDEMLFIHKGSGRCKTMYGTVDFEYGDYAIEGIMLADNPEKFALKSFQISDNIGLKSLKIVGTNLLSLDVSKNINLEKIELLTTLKLANLKFNNNIKDVKLYNQVDLKSLDFNNIKLENLYIKKFTELTNISFQNNKNLKISIVAFGDYCDMKSISNFGKQSR